MAQAYDHKPLSISNSTNTRVIHIDHGYTTDSNGDPTVACKMRVISIEDAVPYIAVSYMWGDPTGKREIFLDGKPFLVTSNLFDLLKMVAEKGYRNLFWIDALCINQEDMTERTHQVALMGQIYSYAKHVLVWLGRANIGLSMALKDLEHHIEQQYPFYNTQRHDETIKRVIEHPYWTRAWIVQELVLANKFYIHCGAESILGASFIQYLEYMMDDVYGQRLDKAMMRTLDESTPIRILRERKRWQSDVEYYIHPWRHYYRAECSDVRDRIYSMIAFMHPAIRISPDYDITSAELFADIVSRHLQHDSTHNFIRSVWNLAEILEVGSDDPTLQICLREWESEGMLSFALRQRHRDPNLFIFPSILSYESLLNIAEKGGTILHPAQFHTGSLQLKERNAQR